MRAHEGTTAPHVLTISGDTPEDREYEVDHPEACPLVCYWWPDARLSVAAGTYDYTFGPPTWDSARVFDGVPECYVRHEIENVGLDCLDGELLYEFPPHPEEGQWGIERWRRLPPGRYLLEGWWHDGYGTGELGGQGDADGGLALLGREGDLPPA